MWIIKFESGAEVTVKANSYSAAKSRADAMCKSTASRKSPKYWALVKKS